MNDRRKDPGSLDDILQLVGSWGLWNWILLVLSFIRCFFTFCVTRLSLECRLSCLLASFAHLSIVFLAFKPPTTSPLTCEEDWASENVTFDTSVMRKTIVTEFRLVCDRATFLPLLTFSYMLAIALTNLFSGENIPTQKIFQHNFFQESSRILSVVRKAVRLHGLDQKCPHFEIPLKSESCGV